MCQSRQVKHHSNEILKAALKFCQGYGKGNMMDYSNYGGYGNGYGNSYGNAYGNGGGYGKGAYAQDYGRSLIRTVKYFVCFKLVSIAMPAIAISSIAAVDYDCWQSFAIQVCCLHWQCLLLLEQAVISGAIRMLTFPTHAFQCRRTGYAAQAAK